MTYKEKRGEHGDEGGEMGGEADTVRKVHDEGLMPASMRLARGRFGRKRAARGISVWHGAAKGEDLGGQRKSNRIRDVRWGSGSLSRKLFALVP